MTTIGRGAAHLEKVEAPGAMLTTGAARALALLRIATGFIFLWAFLDKTFRVGCASPAARPGLDQRRLPHQGLPVLGRGRPAAERLPLAGRQPDRGLAVHARPARH